MCVREGGKSNHTVRVRGTKKQRRNQKVNSQYCGEKVISLVE